MKKISVIIPIYNAEMYIEECIESVRKQTIQDLEIVCVDDGSLDDSESIIQKIASKDLRIKLIRQKNQGAGNARNNGLKNATGKYVAFLDADDYFYDIDALKKMVERCEKDKVNVCGSFSKRNDNNRIMELNFWGEDRNMISDKIFEYGLYQIDYGFTSFIYNREFLISNNIFFPDISRYEDPVFMVKALHLRWLILIFTVIAFQLWCLDIIRKR